MKDYDESLEPNTFIVLEFFRISFILNLIEAKIQD